MATSLGSLVVSLGLNAAEFVTGLSKAELEAQRFKQRLEAGVAAAGRAAAVGITLITTAAIAAGVAVDQLVKEAARFKDLEEITGASAESLASFAVSAKVAGTDMNTIATASVKLTKNLTGVDDESKAAGAAIAALGLNIKDFKQLDPASQIEAISKALVGFADGSAKTAVAVALLGKNGAELLPFLKELGSGVGRQNILTQAQIDLADEYSDKQARATATLQLYLQVAATQALPALIALTGAGKELIAEIVGLDKSSSDLANNSGIETFAINSAKVLAVFVDGIETAVRGLEILKVAATKGVFGVGEISSILERRLFSQRLEDQLAALEANKKFPGEGGGRRRERPELKFDGPKPGGTGGADRVSEAQRFLDSLQKQVDRTLELTSLELALKEIQSGRLKGLTPAIESQIIATAKQIDSYKELQVWLDKTNKAFAEEIRAVEEAAKAQARATDAAFREADQIKDANNNLRDEIAIILGGDAARKALEKDHIAAAIAIKEEALASIQLDAARKGEADAIQSQITLLKERQELLTGKDIAENLRREAEAMAAFKNTITDSFANAFEGFISGTKTAKDAFKDFATSVTKYLNQLALQKLGDSLFGSTTAQGPDIFSMLPKLLGIGGTDVAKPAAEATGPAALTGAGAALTASGAGLDVSAASLTASGVGLDASAVALTGAAAALTAAAAASAVSDTASGIAGIFGSALSGVAQGGGLAGGTDNWRGGPVWVGENGPEIVDLPPGARVTPNDRISARQGNVVHLTVNVPRGTSGPSADQIALHTGAAVQRALARNG